MHSYQRAFIEFAIEYQVLKFGEFKLKSGRVSPYFFNAGLFNDGQAMVKLGEFYAAAIMEHNLSFQMLFGPAYKGIPLVTAVAMALADHYQYNVPFAYNRKEKKNHGEGGSLVGAPVRGDVLLVDDVITAGTAMREAMTTIKDAKGSLSCAMVAIDRQERAPDSDLSAIEAIRKLHGVDIYAIVTLNDIIKFVDDNEAISPQQRQKMHEYQQRYGFAN